MRIPHPAVIEIALATSQSLNKGAHRFPSALTHAVRTLTVYRCERLPHTDVASMLDGILVLHHQVGVNRLAHSRDAHTLQLMIVVLIIHIGKIT